METNLKLSDEYVPNADYRFIRVDKRKPFKLDDLMQELYYYEGGGGVHVIIIKQDDELPEPVDNVDVYDTRTAGRLLAESNGYYLVDGQGNVLAGDKYRFKEIMTKKWGIEDSDKP